MNEVLEVIKDKYFSKGKSAATSQLQRVRVRNAILNLCEEKLNSPNDILVFEVMSNSLPFAVAVLEDELLVSQFEVVQIAETLFEARMVTLEGVI